MVINYSN